jgi:hypothetical protein
LKLISSVSEMMSFWMFSKSTISNTLAFLFTFQIFICKAIKIPITTRIISPKAYFRYLAVLFSLRRF